jgi:hypothetical protein
MWLEAMALVMLLDGAYAGTIRCGMLSDLRRPLDTEFSMTVSGTGVTYERPIVRPGTGGTGAVRTGSFERGKGTISTSGALVLHGRCESPFSCDADYRGQMGDGAMRLTGTQRWQVRNQTEERSCQVDLRRTP